MSYNEAHFSAKENQAINNKLTSLLTWQSHVVDYMARYLTGANGQNQLTGCIAFFQLLAKIRFNLDAINHLLPLLYDDYRFKISVNLLYRAVVDDVVNSYYLFCTVALADPDQHALTNELAIFHKEFLLSSIIGINADREFEKMVDGLKEIESTPDIDVEQEFKNANPDLFNTDGTWKKNAEIRATTSPYFTNLYNQNNGNPKSFISESKKIEFIKARGVTTHHNLEAMFKYLSQFQHYSPKAHDLLISIIDFDVEIYQRCLGEVVMLLDQLFQVVVLNGKDELKSEWDALAPQVFDSFSIAPNQ